MFDDLPLFPLGLVLLPGELQPLHVFEPRYRELVERCERNDEPFGIVLADADGVREIGCTAVIAEVLERFPDGRSNILTRGVEPIRIDEVLDVRSYHTGVGEVLDDRVVEAPEGLQQRALETYDRLLEHTPGGVAPDRPAVGPRLSYALAGRIEFGHDVKLALLEDRDEVHRLEVVIGLVAELTRGLQVAAEVQARARANGRVRTPEEIAAYLGL